MATGVVMRSWSATRAVLFMLAVAAPAMAQTQQPPAPAQHGYLGVELRSITREEAQAPSLPVHGGAAITKVEAESPAGTAGLRRGDILLEIDGKPAGSAAQVLKLIAGKTPGTAVKLQVLRQGRLRAGPVKLGAKPGERAAAVVPAASEVQEPAPQGQEAPAAERINDPAAQDKLPAEVVPQMGHSFPVTSVAFSPDGRFALSGSWDQTLKLWDVATGRELRRFIGHANWVTSVAFSPDGRFALSGSQNNTMKLWDVATGKELRSFSGHTGNVASVAFSPDGRFALSGSGDNTMKLWDVATGKELRSFGGHTGNVASVAFSPDGRFALSGSWDQTLKLWDAATGRELRRFIGHTNWVTSVAFSCDGRFALSGSYDDTMKLWELATGKELRSFSGHTGNVASVAFSPDGRFALSGSHDNTMKLWEVAAGKELRSFTGYTARVTSVAFSPDGRFVLSSSNDKTLKLWDVATGRKLRSFTRHEMPVNSVAFSPDGRFALGGTLSQTVELWDVASGKTLRGFGVHSAAFFTVNVAFSPDGRFALTGSCDEADKKKVFRCIKGALKLWEISTGEELRSFTGHTNAVNSVAFSPDGRFALSGSCGKNSSKEDWNCIEGSLKLWDVATGEELRSFSGHTDKVQSVVFSPDGRFALSGSQDNTMKLWDTATGKEVRSFTGHTQSISSVAFSPDGRFALSGGWDQTLKLWDVTTGRELRSFRGHTNQVASVGFSPDGLYVLSGSADGTTRIWDAGNGREIAQMMAAPNGEWLTMTPQGFFSGSHRDTDMLAIVRGLEATTIGQVHQSLFNPDLVREALAGDPDGEVKRAAEVVSLEKVLDAGPPPVVAIASHEPGSRSSADLVTVAARITDRGKGIGRIEWRVNGITAGVMAAPAGAGPDYDVSQELALDPGENRIEVIAYEKRNLLASLPARTTIAYDGPADSVKPKLHILAIGINAYQDRGWTPPGSSEKLAFPPLNLAAADAKAFAAEMQKAGAGLYSEVRVTEALDADATAAKLDALVEHMAAGIGPRDTFVLYAAAHGYSLNGRYYMIPQDYQGGTDPEALKARAIGQERLQDWIANRIKARKAVILLDTCESGALVGGYTKSRADAPASEAAIGRLHEATGRPVLTAAATGKPAFEGYKRHGVFTYALMEALHKGDSNNNGKIELSELVAHVEERVPELVAELGEHGGVVKGAAVVAMRGAEGDKQSAHFGSTGEDFAIAARLP